MSETDERFMTRAIELARAGMNAGAGGPFGCVVVRAGEIIGEGNNQVTSANDPTAHAEIVAIRNACAYLGSFQLDDCVIYTSCEPCPMCLGAIYWARPSAVFIGADRSDAARAGFDDAFIYDELALAEADRKLEIRRLMSDTAARVFDEWIAKADKIEY